MIAHAARRRGHVARTLDVLLDGEPGIRSAVKTFRPEIIGLSLRNIDGDEDMEPKSRLHGYKELIRCLREEISCPIVLGGSAYSLFPEAILRETRADFGIVGEGERLFCDLADRLAGGLRPAARIHYNRRSLISDLPAPARDARILGYYAAAAGIANIQTKRGCPLDCAYCDYPFLEGRHYRFRPPGEVAEELGMLRDKHGLRRFAFADAVFNDTEGRYWGIVEEIIRRKIKISWTAFFKPRAFTAREVGALKASGLRSAEWGTDCSTDQTLSRMGKDFTWKEVLACNRLFTAAGIDSLHRIILGGPGEDRKTLSKGVRNILGLKNCAVSTCAGVRIFPGTRIHELALKAGAVGADDELLEPRRYFSPLVSPAAVTAAHRLVAAALPSAGPGRSPFSRARGT